MAGPDPGALERLRALSLRAEIESPRVIEGHGLGFRHRARLAIRGRANNPKLGLFELGSHRVVNIPECRVQHRTVNEIAGIVRRVLVEFAIPPYSDAAHAGRARYLQVVVERESGRGQVTLVTSDETPAGLDPLFDRLEAKLAGRLHSLFWNGNPARTNTILGPHWQKFAGPDSVSDSIGGVRLHYPPGAFGQSNLVLAERLSRRVGELVPDGARVLELYAGVGTIGLPLAQRSSSLTLNELNPDSLAGLELGIRDLAPDVAERVRVAPGAAADCLASLTESDVVIVDPPRRGLDSSVVSRLIATPPERLVYASCGLESFLEQAEALRGSGRFELRGLELYVMFPYTEHVETLAWFDRRP
jgi:tRNA/tmRNA/rRNA uracil-C5-methylase (TrmA/RlmC/RlmD family)